MIGVIYLLYNSFHGDPKIAGSDVFFMSTSHHIYKHRIVTHQEIIYIFHTCLVWFMMKHWSIYYTLEIPFFTVFFFYFHGLHTEMEKKNHQVNYDFINLHFFFHTCHVTNAVKNLVNCIFLSLIIRIYTGEISNSLYNKKKKKKSNNLSWACWNNFNKNLSVS